MDRGFPKERETLGAVKKEQFCMSHGEKSKTAWRSSAQQGLPNASHPPGATS